MATSLSAQSLFSVPGQVAVVTGGGTGLGLMFAKALAQNGAERVYILGRRFEVLQKAAATASPTKGPQSNITPVQCDVTSKDSLAAVADKVKAEYGRLDLLVINSGIVGPGMAGFPGKDAPIEAFQKFHWEKEQNEMNRAFEVNNTAAYFTAMAFLCLLDEGNKRRQQNVSSPADLVFSQIIITASIASYIRMVVSGWAYCMAKAGAAQLAKCLATMLAPYQIRSNAIAPGIFPSELTGEMIARHSLGFDEEKGVAQYDKNFIPTARSGTEPDMGGTVLYMASRAGAYLNGCVIVLDGGRLSIVPATY